MRRPVRYAKLHQSLFVPAIGHLKDTLPPDNKTLTGLEMWATELGVSVQAKEIGEMLVPWPNVVSVQFDIQKEAREKAALDAEIAKQKAALEAVEASAPTPRVRKSKSEQTQADQPKAE